MLNFSNISLVYNLTFVKHYVLLLQMFTGREWDGLKIVKLAHLNISNLNKCVCAFCNWQIFQAHQLVPSTCEVAQNYFSFIFIVAHGLNMECWAYSLLIASAFISFFCVFLCWNLFDKAFFHIQGESHSVTNDSWCFHTIFFVRGKLYITLKNYAN